MVQTSPFPGQPPGSNAPPAGGPMIQHNAVVNYAHFAAVTMMLYDQAITFDQEVATIWPQPLGIPKILFLLSRYVCPYALLLHAVTNSTSGLSPEFCHDYAYWQAIPPRLAYLVAHAFMSYRVSAIYGNTQRIIIFLMALFSAQFAALVTLVSLGVLDSTGLPQPPSSAGCMIKSRTGSVAQYSLATWLIPVIFEPILLGMVLYQLSWQMPRKHKLGRVLARDSIVYFILIFSLSLANIVIYTSSFRQNVTLLLGISSAFACISVARMSLNMRAFAKDADWKEPTPALTSIEFSGTYGHPTADQGPSPVATQRDRY